MEGEVQDDPEVLLIIKSDRERLSPLTDALREHHPYDCPEVVALPIVGGSDDYLEWVKKTVSGR